MDRLGDHMHDATVTVARIIEASDADFTESAVFLVRAILDLSGSGAHAREAAVADISEVAGATDPVTALLPLLMARLRGGDGAPHAPCFVTFCLIALSETGIRPGTLARMFRRILSSRADGGPVEWAVENWASLDTEVCLQRLSEALTRPRARRFRRGNC